LSYDEDTAGGFMTTALCTAEADETVGQLRARLQDMPPDEHQELDAIVVTDDKGLLLADLPIVELFVANDTQKLGELTHGPEPVTVEPDATVAQAAELLTESRRASVLVVADDGRPLGRILADDIIDAMAPEGGRFRFPRVLGR
jgi:Mg/Co/Ni transporter MgtE